jgi:hypothetical protein
MTLNKAAPGSPDWFMSRQVTRILNNQARYDELEDYTTGNHPFPSGDRRYVKALREFQKMCRTNYYGLVTMSPVERMKVNGIKFNGQNEADESAAEMWLANDMDFQEAMIHLYAATFGDAFVLVSPPDMDSNGQPIFTMEDPRMCGLEYDPVRPTRGIAGARMWQDTMSGRVVGMLYLPESVHYYVGPPVEDVEQAGDLKTLTKRLTTFGSTDGFNLVESAPNPVGVVPLVRYAWNPSLNSTSLAEAESFNLKDVQDRINATVLDRMIITRAQAYKQRWAAGIKIPEGRNGQRKPPFDPGSDVLWAVEDSQAKFGEFTEADIRQILEAVQQDVGDMAAISKTPPHYLLGKIVNASGDALKASEAGLVSKTKLRMRSMGWSHERITRIGYLYLNDKEKAASPAKTIWANPEEQATSNLADAGLKYTQMGIPLALAMEKMEFTPEEIKFAVAEKKKEETRQAALMAVANAQGAQNAQGGGSGSAKPASGQQRSSGAGNAAPRTQG